MGLINLQFVAEVNRNARALFRIEEVENGDVYVKLRSGPFVGIGDDAQRVKQERYSVHYGTTSPTYSTLKCRTDLEDGTQHISVALTDAIKRQNGFSLLFMYRANNLASSYFDLGKTKMKVIRTGAFNPEANTLVLGVFVGHPALTFDVPSGQVLIESVVTKHFKLVVVWHYRHCAASPFSRKYETMTTAPADSLDEAALRRMAGESVETCLQWFEALSTELLVDLLLTYRHFAAGYPDVIAEIDEGLATLERSIVRLDSQFFRDPTISSN